MLSGLEHFNVTEADIQRTIAAGMSHGATYVDIFFEDTLSNSLRLADNKVDSAVQQTDYGAGVRVVAGDHTGYAFTEVITPEALQRAAITASRIATHIKTDHIPINITALPRIDSRYPMHRHWSEITIAERIPVLKRLNNAIFALDKRVTKVIASEMDSVSIIFFVNSLSQAYTDTIPTCIVSAQCVMESGTRREQGGLSLSFHCGAEMLSDANIDSLAADIVNRTAVLFESTQPQGGQMPVVMAAGSSGILLHEAIGHAFEADFNRLGTSIFSDKMGQMICNPLISVVDDGTIPTNRGAVNYDDEGVEGQKTYMVTEGRLTSYLHDRISARHYGVSPTGNGRRESFRCAPIPRMRSTYMLNGPHTTTDIISSVKRGVYVDTFSNGQVQIGAGDFSFYVRSGRMIENGRLTNYIKDFNVIGNGPEALASISMVANDLRIDNSAWTCGKEGQNCPVTCGMPTVLVDCLTIGGIQG